MGPEGLPAELAARFGGDEKKASSAPMSLPDVFAAEAHGRRSAWSPRRDGPVRRRNRGEIFLHRSCPPLALAPIDDIEKGVVGVSERECDGICGT